MLQTGLDMDLLLYTGLRIDGEKDSRLQRSSLRVSIAAGVMGHEHTC